MDATPTIAPAPARHAFARLAVQGGNVHVVLMGPPGAGKGTQAGTVAGLVGVAHVASGDLFRDAIRDRTEYGRKAKPYYDRGELVPDDLTVGMVIERLREPDARDGFILDGFPRSVGQARALDEMLEQAGGRIDRVIDLQVPYETLVKRLSGRWLCGTCHTSYHVENNPPKVAGICDRCGGDLYQRVDDKPETARKRLDVYYRETLPVLEYYRRRGILVDVDGDRPIAEVTRALREALPTTNGPM